MLAEINDGDINGTLQLFRLVVKFPEVVQQIDLLTWIALRTYLPRKFRLSAYRILQPSIGGLGRVRFLFGVNPAQLGLVIAINSNRRPQQSHQQTTYRKKLAQLVSRKFKHEFTP